MIYLGHFYLYLKRENALFSYIIKKVLLLLGSSIVLVIAFFLHEFLKDKTSFDGKEFRMEFYFLITLTMVLSNSFFKSSILKKDFKEYIGLPFNSSNLSLSILILSIFDIDKTILFGIYLISGIFLGYDVLEILVYVMLLQLIFNYAQLKSKNLGVQVLLNLVFGSLILGIFEISELLKLSLIAIITPMIVITAIYLFISIKNNLVS